MVERFYSELKDNANPCWVSTPRPSLHTLISTEHRSAVSTSSSRQAGRWEGRMEGGREGEREGREGGRQAGRKEGEEKNIARVLQSQNPFICSPHIWSLQKFTFNDYLVIEINCGEGNLDAPQPVSLQSLMNIRRLLAIILTTKKIYKNWWKCRGKKINCSPKEL